MRITFGTNPNLALQNINMLRFKLLKGRELPTAMDEFGQSAVKLITYNLETIQTRDTSATERKSSPPFPVGGITDKLIKNIETSVGESIRKGRQIIGGIGNIEYLDINDPIHELTNPARNVKEGHALWRFLEFGTRPHPIIARTKPYLNFYWKKIGRRIKTKSVNHPGTPGRAYWETARYDIGREFYTKIENKIYGIIKRYSKR